MCHAEDGLGIRRCYSPIEVAEITRAARRGSSGTLLMYAADKLNHERGPHVCLSSFGDQTLKLSLPSELSYVISAF